MKLLYDIFILFANRTDIIDSFLLHASLNTEPNYRERKSARCLKRQLDDLVRTM